MIQFDEHTFQMGWFNHQPGEWLILYGELVGKYTSFAWILRVWLEFWQ